MATALKTDNELVAQAIAAAEHDILLFPTGTNKRPCLAVADGWHDEQGRGGFYIASDEPERLEDMFSQPQAAGDQRPEITTTVPDFVRCLAERRPGEGLLQHRLPL